MTTPQVLLATLSILPSNGSAPSSFFSGLRASMREELEHSGACVGSEATQSARIRLRTSTKAFFAFSPDIEHIHVTTPSGGRQSPRKAEHEVDTFDWDDLTPGRYLVEIDDPRFQRWRATDVEPGQTLTAQLEGSAAIELAVLDAASGKHFAGFDVSVRYDGALFHPNTFTLKDREVILGGARFSGLVPEPFTLLISARDMAVFELPVRDMSPGETRELIARMSPGQSVAGIVRFANGQPAGAGIHVLLLPLGTERDLLILDPRTSGNNPRVVRPRWVLTDEKGRFEFTHVAAGEFTPRAWCNAWLAADAASISTGSAHDLTHLTLVLPACGRVHGRILGVTTAVQEDLRLFALPPGGRHYEEAWTTERGLDCVVQPDGSFDLGCVPEGSVQVRIGSDENRREPEYAQGWMLADFGTIDVEAARTSEFAFDLGEKTLGRISVSVAVLTTEQVDIPNLVVSASSASGSSRGTVNGRGPTVLGPLHPGEWKLSIGRKGGGWMMDTGKSVRVVAGQLSTADVEVTLDRAALRFVDQATQAPLARRRIRFTSGNVEEGCVQLDDEGRITLELPRGEFMFRDGGVERDPAGGTWASKPAKRAWPLAGGDTNVRLELGHLEPWSEK